ncbi:MAG: nucleoside-diphosphate kinase [Nanoarchaeota archaeon]
MKVERTLILAKQDAIHRGLVGEIIKRFEQKGMRIAAMKMALPTRKLIEQHYTKDEAMQKETGERTLATWKAQGRAVKETPLEVGNRIREWNIKALEGKPVVAMVFEGFHAVEVGRKIVGHTEPRQALPGTIRGDFSAESYELADAYKRTMVNLVHASGKPHEAEREIKAWFKDDEIFDYEKKDFKILHSFD